MKSIGNWHSDLEESEWHHSWKLVTASEKPLLNQSLGKSSALWVGLQVNTDRLFEELIFGKLVNQRVSFQKCGDSGYCPVFPFDVINLLVRTLLDSRTETQNGFGKNSNLLEEYGNILCNWKKDQTAKREGQSCSGAQGKSPYSNTCPNNGT